MNAGSVLTSALVGLLALSLCACSSNEDADESTSEKVSGYEIEDAVVAPSDDEEEKGGETYSEFDARRDSYEGSRGTFEGDGCTVNCGGHQAGYAWAERKGISDPDECGGKSWSFEEGCRAYAEEQQ